MDSAQGWVLSKITSTQALRPFYFRFCAGFSDAGREVSTEGTVAGVREAPRHEVAGGGRRWCSGGYGD